MPKPPEGNASILEESLDPNICKDKARKFVPLFLRRLAIIRRLGLRAGRIYAHLWLLDVFGVRSENQREVPPSARSFVFVCFGNIMRSALAEFLMRKALNVMPPVDIEKIRILSAGLHANAGRKAHPWAQEAAAELGISLTTHRAKLLTRDTMEAADAVLAMDFQNKAELLTLYPEFAGKVYMLSAYAEGAWRFREIPDPYLGDLEVTIHCAHQLETCIQNLLGATVFSGKVQPHIG